MVIDIVDRYIVRKREKDREMRESERACMCLCWPSNHLPKYDKQDIMTREDGK